MNSSLHHLSNQELTTRLAALVCCEADATLEMLLHLSELEERRLHLSLGYPSLFVYCTKELRLSEGAANRRIKAARCLRAFPEVHPLLKERRVSLSTICIFSPVLTQANKLEVLKRVADQNQAEVERVAAGYQPPAVCVHDRVRAFMTVKPKATRDLAALPLFAESREANSESERAASQAASQPAPQCQAAGSGDALPEPGRESPRELLKFSFAAGPELGRQVERMRVMLSNKFPKGATLGELFSEALGYYIERHAPKAPVGRVAVGAGAFPKAKAAETRRVALHSRYVPAAVKAAVYKRDQGSCAYVGADGVRCGSVWGLEYDHVVPYAKGGESTVANIRLLCSAHNGFEAERAYGREFMIEKISRGLCGKMPMTDASAALG